MYNEKIVYNMAVYVDPLINYGWHLGPSCHLTADTEEELHAFAIKIDMKRSWFQVSKGKEIPHYDLIKSKRDKAIKLGAIELTRRQMVERIQSYIKQ